MKVRLEYFPSEMVGFIKEAVEKMEIAKIESITNEDKRWCEVEVDCLDYTTLVLIGVRMGGIKIDEKIKEVFLPKVYEIIDKLTEDVAKESINPSEN